MLRSNRENSVFPTDLTKIELTRKLLEYSKINSINGRMKELGKVLLAQNELHNRQTSKMARISIVFMVFAVVLTCLNTFIVTI